MHEGDIRKSVEIGYKGTNNRIWHACVGCGKKRWVLLLKGKPDNLRCLSCARCTHGEQESRLYSIWRNMLSRCRNPKSGNYQYYGGRGIEVCALWLKFIQFRDFALSSGYTDILTIDRINNDGDYEPMNCQWLTQAENTRKSNKER